MLTFLARRWAKLRYRFQEEVKTETLLINARSSERTAEKTKLFIQQLQAMGDATDAQAAAIEQNIKEVDEKMMAGFWQCENGDEEPISTAFAGIELEISRTCSSCKKPMKMIRTDLLTGQEKYENEKERREVEKMADGARQRGRGNPHRDQTTGRRDRESLRHRQVVQRPGEADA